MTNTNTDLKQQLIRHQVALRGAMVVAAAVLMLLLGLLPLINSTRALTAKITTREKDLDTLSQKVAVLNKIDQSVLKERTAIIKQALPETKDVIAYLRAVDGLSRELGVSFGGITVSPGEITGNSAEVSKKSRSQQRKISQLDVLDTNIKVTGNRDGIYAFLRQVEQTLPLMQVADVSVSRVEDDVYTMSLSLGMLWASSAANDLKASIELFTEKEEESFSKLHTFRSYSDQTYNTAESTTTPRTDLFEGVLGVEEPQASPSPSSTDIQE